MGALRRLLFVALGLMGCLLAHGAEPDVRVKDLGKVEGWRDNPLVGYGIVTGLAGSGDSPNNRAARQALANVLTGMDLTLSADQIQSRNVAVVMISAVLPPFARGGDKLDVTVTSAGDARSLLGGALLLTSLKGPDGRVYALAQGALSVGGYRYDANGNVVQKNHPTVGAIPGGATVEKEVKTDLIAADNSITFVLSEPDFTTAHRVAQAINRHLGLQLADPKDAGGVTIQVPAGQRGHLVDFLADVENVTLTPDRRARVVVNERTGTVVAGGDVHVDRVAISVGDMKIAVTTQNDAVQPIVLGSAGMGSRATIVRNSEIRVEEPVQSGYVAPGDVTVADLVHTLSRMRLPTRDVISVLQAVKAAGALHAELVIQ